MKLGMPSYELVSTTGPSHKPEFEVSVTVQGLGIFKSMGQSKKIAEQLAAKVLIEELSSTKNNTLKIKSKK